MLRSCLAMKNPRSINWTGLIQEWHNGNVIIFFIFRSMLGGLYVIFTY